LPAQGQTSTGALPAQGQAGAATAQTAGVGATGQTAATKRSPKKATDGAIVTDDDQEEEVEFLDGEDASDFKRWVVKSSKPFRA
jgi:hypothetical protein